MRQRGFVPRWCSFLQDFAPCRALSRPVASPSHPAASHWAQCRTFFQLELAYATARFCAALVLIPTEFCTPRTPSHPAAEVILI